MFDSIFGTKKYQQFKNQVEDHGQWSKDYWECDGCGWSYPPVFKHHNITTPKGVRRVCDKCKREGDCY
jgi:hypothetical protein